MIPLTINIVAPKRGFFVRWINDLKKNAGNLLAPPFLEEALSGDLVKIRFSSFGCEHSSCLFQQSLK
jgi:hypothetical protein